MVFEVNMTLTDGGPFNSTGDDRPAHHTTAAFVSLKFGDAQAQAVVPVCDRCGDLRASGLLHVAAGGADVMLKQKRYTAVVLLVLALIATVFYLFPLVLVLTNSLKTTGEFTSNPFSLPTVLQWGNYSYAFEQMHFLTSLRNSLVITVCVCALIALLGAMAAYAVSRVRHKFVSTIYYLMLASHVRPVPGVHDPAGEDLRLSAGLDQQPDPGHLHRPGAEHLLFHLPGARLPQLHPARDRRGRSH